jgi:uncharacterized repeat protein (TIGR01451 family)
MFGLLLAIWLVSLPANAAPKAGSVIGNQASATYTDENGTEYSATSNLVETIVQPVFGLTLISDRSTFATPGGTVYFPHVLTNAGNDADDFTLLAANSAGDDFDFSSISVFLDADRDGNPDSAQAITSVTLNSAAQINLVVAATVPGLSAADDVGIVTLTATSDSDGTKLATVTDTATVRTGAVVQVLKSMSSTDGFADAKAGSATAYTVTLGYQNTGNSAAANLVITDTLSAGLIYLADSGRASVTGVQLLTDDVSAEPVSSNGSVLTYEYDSVNHEVEFTIDAVAASESGYVRFQVNVLTTDNDGAPLLAGDITNIANFAYDGGVAEPTNAVQFTVNSTVAVVLDGPGLDTQTLASASQGVVASFTHTLNNSGNVDHVFNFVISNSDYPAGTAFKLFRSDGVTPLVDSNGDGIVDAGILAAGASIDVVMKVYLPANGQGGPFQVTLTAQSVSDPTISDATIDEVTLVTALAADLTANASAVGGGDGIGLPGAGGEATPVDSNNVAPGASVEVPLFINNQTDSADNYDFSIDNLPAGWTVKFYLDSDGDGTIDANEAEFVNSGLIPANSSQSVIAVLTTPAAATPGDVDLVFHIKSPNSSAEDYLKYRITVDSTYGLDVALDNSSQAAAGSSVVFTHRLLNTGNTASGDITLSLAHSNSGGWTATIYIDDGATPTVLDSTDSVYNPGLPPSLAAGAETTLFVRVIVPPSATVGAVDTVTLTATITTPGGPVSDTASDTITVISTEIDLRKVQALDSACDGTADTAFSSAGIVAGAVPGACLIYQVTAVNSGSEAVTSVVIYDSTPNFTTLETAGLTPVVTVGGSSYTSAGDCSTSTPGIDIPADETSGTLTGSICNLPAGASGQLQFSVQIDP